MSDSSALTLSPARETRIGLIDRIVRKAVLSRLHGLRGGEVTVTDAGGTRTYGDASAPGDLRARVTVLDPSFYRRIAFGGSMGAGEAFMEGLWTAEDLPALLQIFVRNIELLDGMEKGLARLAMPAARFLHGLRKNTRAGSRKNIEAHYDLGNAFFKLFLDETMTYSSGIFATKESTLAEASIEKLDRMCRKLQLTPGDHVIEIGTGWGSFAIHAASRYGCKVTTTTISGEQHDLARERIDAAGLGDRIELLSTDYRDLEGAYDKLVSIEMIEAVGHEFYGDYFAKCASLLRRGGRMAIQAITMPDAVYPRYLKTVDFIQRHVFPGSCLPSLGAMTRAAAGGTDLKLVLLEEIGLHYARTLAEWRERFMARLDDVRSLGYPERFVRMWDYYLAYCEAGFAERYIGNLQLVWERPS